MDTLFNNSQHKTKTENKPVTVLGCTFTNDDERLIYFREELRMKLPELKLIEGFPIGKDEDILNLSDPPFYTACPNPWIPFFLKQWEKDKLETYGEMHELYHREPFATDVSEGKSDPIYNAHSYHTKVPHKAIMRYILHYTNPGDIVFDGFCGTGMTGVAAKMCADRNVVMELGYQVTADGNILKEEIGEKGKTIWTEFSKLGERKAILNDLSPAATAIANNYNNDVDVLAFSIEAKKILSEIEMECSWMYETMNPERTKKGVINYVVWSEVNKCPDCGESFIFFDEARDSNTKKLRDEFVCPHCGANLVKGRLEVVYESVFDEKLNTVIKQTKRIPVLINYTIGKKKFEKIPDSYDLEILEKIRSLSLPKDVPFNEIPDMQMMRVGRMKGSGVTHMHHFFLSRPIQVLGLLWEKVGRYKNSNVKALLQFWIDSHMVNLSIRNRYRPEVSFPYNPLSGVFYVPSMVSEPCVFPAYSNKINRIVTALLSLENRGYNIVQTCSASSSMLPSDSQDYIFTDPPFGENIYYSDLNFFVESWYKVFTNTTTEAIVDRVKGKELITYQQLMKKCFFEYYRILKPGHWITVEFSNSKASVWNSIQSALKEVGFVIGNIAALDKQQSSFQSITSPTAVKQDLVITAYKPSSEFDTKFSHSQNSEVGIWDFVVEHLSHLPVHLVKENSTAAVIERSAKILFDRLIAFYVQRNLPVPIDAGLFQKELRERLIERDGMFFTGEQVQEYDNKKAKLPNFVQLSLLVASEQDGVMWLRRELEFSSPTLQELHPKWMQALAGVRKGDILPELRDILDENFLQNESGAWFIPDLENEIDLEKVRTRRLLKQFDSYKEQALKPKGKIKEARVDALRIGFKQCYKDKDFKTIVSVGDCIPNNLLMEDEVLLQFYDIAISRV